MDHVVPAPPVVALAVDGGTGRFPVRRVYCVGRNYAGHVREMGGDPDREPPFFFMKPADAVIPGGGRVPYPPVTNQLHHEIELVAAIGKAGTDIPRSRALDHVFGYGVGIDLTRRDLQAEAKKAGRPWDMAKGFDASGPCSAIRPVAAIGHPAEGAITLAVNGETRQAADIAAMTWSVAEVVSHLSHLVELRPGDLVFTGTPDGVGAVAKGDRLEGAVAGIGEIVVDIV